MVDVTIPGGAEQEPEAYNMLRDGDDFVDDQFNEQLNRLTALQNGFNLEEETRQFKDGFPPTGNEYMMPAEVALAYHNGEIPEKDTPKGIVAKELGIEKYAIEPRAPERQLASIFNEPEIQQPQFQTPGVPV